MKADAKRSQDIRRRLLLFPCNGNAIESLDCLGGDFEVIGLVDDDPVKRGTERFGYPVLSREAFADHPDAGVLAVPGSPQSYLTRVDTIEGLGLPEARFVSILDGSARVSPRARLGLNTLVMAGSVITSNAIVGNHVIILPNSVVHHDAVVGDWTIIGSGATVAGGVRIGRNCYIGSGSRIIENITIGDGALVGLGSVVVRPVPAGSKVAGNPARPVDNHGEKN